MSVLGRLGRHLNDPLLCPSVPEHLLPSWPWIFLSSPVFSCSFLTVSFPLGPPATMLRISSFDILRLFSLFFLVLLLLIWRLLSACVSCFQCGLIATGPVLWIQQRRKNGRSPPLRGEPMFIHHIVITLSWWAAFSQQNPPPTYTEVLHHLGAHIDTNANTFCSFQ